MSNKISNNCQVRSSKVGAKNFFYPCEEQTGLFIRKGTAVEMLPYLSGRDNVDLQAIAVPNNMIEGSPLIEGVGVYWVDRKNLD